MDKEALYRSIILEESRNRDYFQEMPEADLRADGFNPGCGDELSFYLAWDEKDPLKIAKMSYAGHGCAISCASASILCGLSRGKNREDMLKRTDLFTKMIRETPESLEKEEKRLLGDGLAFSGVANMPARVKCAMLAWNTLRKMLLGDVSELPDDVIEDSADLID